jgi:hypothetical protein
MLAFPPSNPVWMAWVGMNGNVVITGPLKFHLGGKKGGKSLR